MSAEVRIPLDVQQLRRGWESLERESSYWVPQADIIGQIPRGLRGTFLRNGPGVNAVYGKRLKHPIDGDGMVCALTFIDGRVHFRSKFVSSSHRREERDAGKVLYDGQMGTRATGPVTQFGKVLVSLLSGKKPKIKFRNPSNTSVFYWGGKVLTTYETNLPHCLDPYTLETMGLDDLGGTLKLHAMAAHYRVDMKKKRLICLSLRVRLNGAAEVGFYEFDEHWHCCNAVHHSIAGLNYIHDFVLLPQFYLVHMTPFVKVSTSLVLKWAAGISSPGEEMRYHSDLPSKFVLIPRPGHSNPNSTVIMINTEPFHIFHYGTAYQDRHDNIHFTAVCLDTNFNMTFDDEIALSNVSVSPGRLFKFHIDVKQLTCSQEMADLASVEFPTVHPFRHGLSTSRYNYLMASDRQGYNLPYRDVIKFDHLSSSRQVYYSHGSIGEPVFAPRHGYSSYEGGDDDDGYVLVQLYNPELHRTEFIVLDARHIDADPCARICLKHHIPYGFHGSFTPDVFVSAPPTSKL